MRIPSLLLPLVSALEDESTLLSLSRSHLDLSTESATEHLLEAATSRNVSQMQALMQNLVEESMKGDGIAELDADIKDAMKVIQDTLLKGIKDTLVNEHRLDQKEIMEQLNCFDDCRAARTVSETKCLHTWAQFEKLVEQHVNCRHTLRGWYTAKITSCGRLDGWVEGFTLEAKPFEECVYDGAYECHTTVCKEGECNPEIDGEFGRWLKRIIGQATAGYETWTVLHGQCKADYHGYIRLDSKCDIIEKEQERKNGETRQCEHTACEVEYTKCRAECIAEYHKLVKRVECSEKDRKIDWSSTEKIECYIRILLNSPTNDELQKVCEDGQNCISKWRTSEYNKCSAVCPNVDYGAKDAEYQQHARRDAESGEYLKIKDEADTGLDGAEVIGYSVGGQPAKYGLAAHTSTQSDIQHADDDVLGDTSPGVNTTHRRKDGGDEARCTWHLDIDFQPIPCAIPCPPPRPCCDEKYIELYEARFTKMIDVTEVADKRKCHTQHPGEHTERWAYNLCRCCKSHCQLIGTPAITDDEYCCPGHGGGQRPGPDRVTGFAGSYSVWYKGGRRDTGATIDCDGNLEQPGIFADKLHTANVKEICNQDRDKGADYFILGSHGALKYECVKRAENGNLVGNHYLDINNRGGSFWGTIEYKVEALALCIENPHIDPIYIVDPPIVDPPLMGR